MEKVADRYVLEDGVLYFRKTSEGEETPFIVPKTQDRAALVKKAHLLGHFKEESTKKESTKKESIKGKVLLAKDGKRRDGVH